jgi:hypothetical protein
MFTHRANKRPSISAMRIADREMRGMRYCIAETNAHPQKRISNAIWRVAEPKAVRWASRRLQIRSYHWLRGYPPKRLAS